MVIQIRLHFDRIIYSADLMNIGILTKGGIKNTDFNSIWIALSLEPHISESTQLYIYSNKYNVSVREPFILNSSCEVTHSSYWGDVLIDDVVGQVLVLWGIATNICNSNFATGHF